MPKLYNIFIYLNHRILRRLWESERCQGDSGSLSAAAAILGGERLAEIGSGESTVDP
jgi:hypothetical protein